MAWSGSKRAVLLIFCISLKWAVVDGQCAAFPLGATMVMQTGYSCAAANWQYREGCAVTVQCKPKHYFVNKEAGKNGQRVVCNGGKWTYNGEPAADRCFPGCEGLRDDVEMKNATYRSAKPASNYFNGDRVMWNVGTVVKTMCKEGFVFRHKWNQAEGEDYYTCEVGGQWKDNRDPNENTKTAPGKAPGLCSPLCFPLDVRDLPPGVKFAFDPINNSANYKEVNGRKFLLPSATYSLQCAEGFKYPDGSTAQKLACRGGGEGYEDVEERKRNARIKAAQVSVSSESVEVSTADSHSQESSAVDEASDVEVDPSESEADALNDEKIADPSEPGANHIIIRVSASVGPFIRCKVVKSPVTIADGLPWELELVRMDSEAGVDSLKADILSSQLANEFAMLIVDYPSPMWSCEAEGTITVIHPTGNHKVFPFTCSFDHDTYNDEDLMAWDNLLDPTAGFLVDGKVTVEARFLVKNVVGLRKVKRYDFTSPNHLTDGILLIEGRKLFVSRQLLAHHSVFFDALFFGQYKNEKVMVIEGVGYQAFVDLLHFIYPSGEKFTVDGVAKLLEIAHKFGVEEVIDKAEAFIMSTTDMTMGAKWILSDRFKLCALQTQCLATLTSAKKVKDLAFTDDYGKLSEKLRLAIMERMLFFDDDKAKDDE